MTKLVPASVILSLFILVSPAGCTMRTSDSGSPRTPAFIREHGNHLTGEASLYLQQHAHNPVDWYPWGDEALARARELDRPVFLSIGYSSCHWCHVMEEEVFAHDEVAAYLNDHFICIKVDREERPDLDTVYMNAVQAMTGRGGWPMSTFLTPDLEPFYGGTYFPRAQFMDLVEQIVAAYRDRREDIDQQAAQLAAHIAAQPVAMLNGDESLDEALITAAVDGAKERFDTRRGGFLQNQKFPTPVKWRFLLHRWRRAGDDELRDMIARTLEAMQGGGIHDLVGGGFHRYTVDPDWTVPHFEKMLYDNGQLAGLFLEAGVALSRPDFIATGSDVLDFLLREMRTAGGAFCASFDADSGGEEGSYYVWSRDDILEVAGQDDGPALAELMGVAEHGNFENSGKSVPTWRADPVLMADRYGLTPATAGALLTKYRVVLRRERDRRTAPGLDTKVVSAWNALTISALAQGYAVTGHTRYLEGAVKAADFLLSRHLRPDGSLRRTSDGDRTAGEGILDDYALLVSALLDVYQVSEDPDLQVRYLGAARALLDFARHEFQRAEGGYFMSRDQVRAPLGRPVDTFDNVTPSGLSAMHHALLAMSALTGETGYREESREDLGRWAELMRRAGIETAWMLDAVGKTLSPLYEVVIAGEPGHGDAVTLRQAYLDRLPDSAVLTMIPADGPTAPWLKLAPALAGKTVADGHATAYVCEFGACQRPVHTAPEMLQQLGLVP